MKEQKFLESLKKIIINKEFEDNERELNLAIYHINKSRKPMKDYEYMAKGLKKGIPVSYIIGYTLIGDVPIRINKNVLNPGPETLTLIGKAIDYVIDSKSETVLDLCTGSGAIAVSVAKKCKTKVVATDISKKALAIAKLNASENKVVIDFKFGDLFDPVRGMVFNAIISNPPYVKSGAIDLLPGFVRNFAPLKAIDGGVDGLFFHKAIMSGAKDFLHSDGSLFIECEDNQDKEVEEIAIKTGWEIKDKFPNRKGNIRGFKLRQYKT